MRNGLVEGVTLRAVLRESGAMAPEAAASVLAGMLMTLAVVHGDVRPEHVRVDGSGGLALTGFGGEDARFVPNEPTYLAPERLTGTPPDAGGDVFSATAVFFECLTSEAPFVAATGDDLAALHEYAEVIAEFAPPELRTLTQHGLAPDPQRRPTSPHGFLAEVTGTATEVYGSDWQARGRALLSGWAADAARADGLELAAAPGRSDAPARAAAMAASEGAPEGA
uniref:protein kinase domain-containing protein n=1 Tax=Catenulispora pinisilvae TaxID=2705253 RepID=UPI003F6A074D